MILVDDISCPGSKFKALQLKVSPCNGCVLPTCNDTKMLILDGDSRSHFHLLDASSGRLLETVKDESHIANVRRMGHIPKVTSRALQPSFLVVSPAGALRVSTMRKRASKFAKIYLRKNKFAYAAVSESEALVLASEKGDLRVFNRFEHKRATKLRLNEVAVTGPLRGLEITRDGSLILMVFSEVLRIMDYTNFTLSELRMSASAKVDFRCASFSQEAPEKFIIATGKYAIFFWALSIKSGKWVAESEGFINIPDAGCLLRAFFLPRSTSQICVVHTKGVKLVERHAVKTT